MTLNIEVKKISSPRDNTKPSVGDRIWRSIGKDGKYKNKVGNIFKRTNSGDKMFRCWYKDQLETSKPVYSSQFGPDGYYTSKPHNDKGLVCIIKGDAQIDSNFAFAEVTRISTNNSTAFVELFNAPIEVVKEKIQGNLFNTDDRINYQRLQSFDSMDTSKFGDLKMVSDNGQYRFWLQSRNQDHPKVIVERDITGDDNWKVIDVYNPLTNQDEMRRDIKKNMDGNIDK